MKYLKNLISDYRSIKTYANQQGKSIRETILESVNFKKLASQIPGNAIIIICKEHNLKITAEKKGATISRNGLNGFEFDVSATDSFKNILKLKPDSINGAYDLNSSESFDNTLDE